MNFLLTAAGAATTTTDTGLFSGSGLSMAGTLISVVLFAVVVYFFMIKPQKAEQKKQAAMLSSMEVGDYVVTTSGFYGTIIDITEEDVIVEFGSNKNCRIPMKKAAIAQIEKANEE